MESILEKFTDTAELPSLPNTYLRLQTLLEEPDYALAEVAVLISNDPSLAMRLLRMVNSAYFGMSAQIVTVSHALSILGTDQVHNLVLATSVANAFKGIPSSIMDMQQFCSPTILVLEITSSAGSGLL
jgi:HD-like signal output (HDOD) protein